MKHLIKLTLMIFAVNIFILAQHKDYSKETGYIDFGNLEELESGNRVVDVFLEGNLLRLVGKFAENEEPELSEVISGLKLIKAKVLEVTRENEKQLKARVLETENLLKGKNWSMLVRIRDVDEIINVYIKSSSLDKIEGLTVTSINKDEAAFVNIVGDIDLETIGRLSSKFDIPALDRLNGHKR